MGLGLEVGVSLFENEAQDDVLVPLEGTPLESAGSIPRSQTERGISQTDHSPGDGTG